MQPQILHIFASSSTVPLAINTPHPAPEPSFLLSQSRQRSAVPKTSSSARGTRCCAATHLPTVHVEQSPSISLGPSYSPQQSRHAGFIHAPRRSENRLKSRSLSRDIGMGRRRCRWGRERQSRTVVYERRGKNFSVSGNTWRRKSGLMLLVFVQNFALLLNCGSLYSSPACRFSLQGFSSNWVDPSWKKVVFCSLSLRSFLSDMQCTGCYGNTESGRHTPAFCPNVDFCLLRFAAGFFYNGPIDSVRVHRAT